LLWAWSEQRANEVRQDADEHVDHCVCQKAGTGDRDLNQQAHDRVDDSHTGGVHLDASSAFSLEDMATAAASQFRGHGDCSGVGHGQRDARIIPRT
jgi:hypothetical protein